MSVTTENSAGPPAIRPFTIEIPEAEIEALRARIAAARWPDKETVADHAQGVQLATIQKLARYWATDHDWRKCETKLNALPQFMTEIDGLDIHFIHVRSDHENALPLIVTHGWPGSVIELLKIIDRLTNPTAHGASASDAFHLVIPSMPGYGFSGKPTSTGWDPARIARAWVVLMKRLGYTQFAAQGGEPSAIRSLSRRKTRVGTAELRIYEGYRLCSHDGDAPANVVRIGGFTRRPGSLYD
ncbi:epoxide hydrolase family protein [Carbonactinospora thermoautotrophica]|uniref:epoxide hydrolase family protein n=1 Tax=Carbonactinospora thermoautotrophica TaxID=1469144 RepID=UPI003DA92C99